MKIAATIDGSDSVRITSAGATWTHGAFEFPSGVRVNGTRWSNPSNVLKNAGATAFLPPGVDFSTARITARRGRDLAAIFVEKDSVVVNFADNPNGDDLYEVELAFGP